MPEEILPRWRDSQTGRTAPIVPGQAFDPKTLGQAVALHIPAQEGRYYGVAIKIVSQGGGVVFDKMDTDYPYVAAKLDKGPMALPNGAYAYTIALMADRKTPAGPAIEGTFILAASSALPSGSISGVLFNDDDGDNVLDATEKASGVRNVCLSDPAGKVTTTMADAQGRYVFTNLAAGTYRVGRESYPPGYKASNPAGFTTVAVGEGQAVTGVNIGTTKVAAGPSEIDMSQFNFQPAPAFVRGLCVVTALEPKTPVRSPLWNGVKTAADVLLTAGFEEGREWATSVGDMKKDVVRVASLVPAIGQWKRAGFKHFIIVLAAGDGKWDGLQVPTAAASKAAAEGIAAAIPADLRGVVGFEIGNEQNDRAKYWPGTEAEFVNNFANPMAEVFNAAGYVTILGGVNWSDETPAAAIKKYIALGVKTTKIGWHPYAESLSAFTDMLGQVTDAADGRPVVCTEWNTKDGPAYLDKSRDTAAVAKAQNAMDAAAAGKVESAFYFSSRYQTQTMSGSLGLFKIDGDGPAKVATTTDLFVTRYGDRFAQAK